MSRQIKAQGVEISHNTVGKLLKDQGYSLRSNRKTIAETHHPDRNGQFEMIEETQKRFQNAGHPILSMDAKKKELIGLFRNPGKAWGQHNTEVLTHDFRSQAVAIATPYGVYEPTLNRGTVVVGTSSDTPEFAVDSLELWLKEFGWETYPKMKHLLLLCDSGGSNGYRSRLWKYRLFTQICRPYGLKISVSHYPPGASKWNPIEHRLFSFITMEWAGYPLTCMERMLDYIRGTTTETGLQVAAFLNSNQYATGIKVSDADFRQIRIKRNPTLPAWNYTISPS